VLIAARVLPGRDGVLRAIAGATTLLALAASLPLWRLFEVRGAQFQFVDRFDVLPTIGTGYVVGVDGLAVLLVLLTTTLACLAVFASWANVTERTKQYFSAVLLLEAGMLGVYVSLDLLLFTLSWTVAAVSMCVLIRATGRDPNAWLRVALVGILPSLLILAGVIALSVHGRALTGLATFDLRMFQNLTLSTAVQRWVFLAFAAGFSAAIVGVFRWWLLAAGSSRAVTVPLLLAAVFFKMGTFGFLRLSMPLLPDATRFFAPVIVGLSAMGIVFGAVAAFAQTSWTRVLAYASLSHVCLVMLGAFALTPDGLTGSAVHQINHGLSIAALFLVAGLVADRGQSVAIADYGGLLNAMPLVAGTWLLLTLSLVGVPKLNGFVGTELIIEGLWPVSRTWAIMAIGGLALGGIALLWLFSRMMLGELRGPAADLLKDLRLREALIVVPLVALVVWAGLKPLPFLATVETSVARVVLRVSPQYAPDVADCLAQPPPKADRGLPAGMVLMAPCSDAAGVATATQDRQKR
jgi:NADH-quinone oxidoreductase subunit M